MHPPPPPYNSEDKDWQKIQSVAGKRVINDRKKFVNVGERVNPLGSEVILGPLRCFDMPRYLCLFQLLITY